MIYDGFSAEFGQNGFVDTWGGIYLVDVVSELVQIVEFELDHCMALLGEFFNGLEDRVSDGWGSLDIREIYHIPYRHFFIEICFIVTLSPLAENIPVFVQSLS